MKKRVLILVIWGVVLMGLNANGQGRMGAGNVTAPTRVGTIDGPLADGNYLGRMLLGGLPESLTPVGPTIQHMNGLTFGIVISVPDHPGHSIVYVQVAAWDSRVWGESIDGVPTDQLGLTDIVLHQLADPIGGFPATYAIFTQAPIVPIPEPSVLALVIMGAVMGGLSWRVRRRVPRNRLVPRKPLLCGAEPRTKCK